MNQSKSRRYHTEPIEYRWQPAETAPKTGVSFLALLSPFGVREIFWCTPYEGASAEHCYFMTPVGPSGRGYIVLPTSVVCWTPMPTPEAPLAPPPRMSELQAMEAFHRSGVNSIMASDWFAAGVRAAEDYAAGKP